MKVLFSIINADVSRSPKHQHSCVEIVYRLCGDSHTTIGDRVYPISKGDMYLLPPKMMHCDSSEGLFSDLAIQVESVDFDEPMVLHDDEGYIEALAFMINRIMNEKEADYRPIANSLADALIQYAKLFLRVENHNSMVEKLKNAIFENIENSDFNLANEIQNSGYNADYMRRQFKAQMQKTPLGYLTDLRIERAKRLLVTNIYESIENISAKCGFHDSFYFSTCFKKRTGVSPLRYRKQNLLKY